MYDVEKILQMRIFDRTEISKVYSRTILIVIFLFFRDDDELTLDDASCKRILQRDLKKVFYPEGSRTCASEVSGAEESRAPINGGCWILPGLYRDQ